MTKQIGTIYEEPLPSRFMEDERKLVFRRRTHGPKAYNGYRKWLFQTRAVLLMAIPPTLVYCLLFYQDSDKPFSVFTDFRKMVLNPYASWLRGVSQDDLKELHHRDRLNVSSGEDVADNALKVTDFKLSSTWLPFISDKN